MRNLLTVTRRNIRKRDCLEILPHVVQLLQISSRISASHKTLHEELVFLSQRRNSREVFNDFNRLGLCEFPQGFIPAIGNVFTVPVGWH